MIYFQANFLRLLDKTPGFPSKSDRILSFEKDKCSQKYSNSDKFKTIQGSI